MLNEYMNAYNKHCKAKGYIIGFERDNTIYYGIINKQDITVFALLSTDKQGETVARVKIRVSDQKELIKNKEVKPLIDNVSFLQLLDKEKQEQPRFNKGRLFEKIITEQIFKTNFIDDQKSFYNGDDVGGYQVKFNRGQFSTLKTLERLENKAII